MSDQKIQGLQWQKWFHSMPNIADDELDPYQYRLFGHYCRVAGGGECWEKVKTTAQKCKMSDNKVTSTRQELHDLGYITIERIGDSRHTFKISINEDELTIKNIQRYKPRKQIPASEISDAASEISDAASEISDRRRTTKEKPTKKEPPETKNSNSKSKIETDKHSDLFLEPTSTVSENDFLEFTLVKWIRTKNSSGKTSARKYEKVLAKERKYDDSKEISALELYESDNVFRVWCDERYSQLHKDSYGDKSLGVEDTVNMVTDEPSFFAWQEKKRGVVESMDETQYDEDLSEYDKMQDKGLDMFEDDDE